MNTNSTLHHSISQRAQNIQTFFALDVMKKVRDMQKKGKDIIRMEVGQPEMPPPEKSIEAVQKVLKYDPIGYTQAAGIQKLRDKIAKHYKETYQICVKPEQILITTGSSAGFVLTFLAAFNPGQKIGLSRPTYPAYKNLIEILGMKNTLINTKAENQWRLQYQHFEKWAKKENLNGFLITNPANPTGAVIENEELKKIIRFAEQNKITLICDEVYHGLTYRNHPQTALKFSNQVIVVNSFSKYYCLTGWRIGWVVVPKNMIRAVEQMAQNCYICPPAPSQIAALAALEAKEQLEEYKKIYQKNREMLKNELQKIGFNAIPDVDGAFYIYAGIAKFSNDSIRFAEKMLNDINVAVTPGVDFDEINGNQYVRMSFAGSHEAMREGIKRLQNWLK